MLAVSITMTYLIVKTQTQNFIFFLLWAKGPEAVSKWKQTYLRSFPERWRGTHEETSSFYPQGSETDCMSFGFKICNNLNRGNIKIRADSKRVWEESVDCHRSQWPKREIFFTNSLTCSISTFYYLSYPRQKEGHKIMIWKHLFFL